MIIYYYNLLNIYYHGRIAVLDVVSSYFKPQSLHLTAIYIHSLKNCFEPDNTRCWRCSSGQEEKRAPAPLGLAVRDRSISQE
jgi:hypothetical protein